MTDAATAASTTVVVANEAPTNADRLPKRIGRDAPRRRCRNGSHRRRRRPLQRRLRCEPERNGSVTPADIAKGRADENKGVSGMVDRTEGEKPGAAARNVEPGGGSSRGPNPSPGGVEEPGGLVPPYEGRTSGAGTPSGDARAEGVARMLSQTKDANAGVTASPADEQPVDSDEVSAEVADSAHGVGVSTTRRGEDIEDGDGQEAGRQHAGTQGSSDRPVGTSDGRDVTGVNPQDSQN